MPCALPPNIIVTGSTAPRSNQEGLKTSDETLGQNNLFETTKGGLYYPWSEGLFLPHGNPVITRPVQENERFVLFLVWLTLGIYSAQSFHYCRFLIAINSMSHARYVVFVLQLILMILTVDLRKMNEWLQQIRAEGLRIVYVTMGNVAEEGSIQPLFWD